MERRDLDWRYEITALDYEELRRELGSEPCLRMRETETYYAYIRRLELLGERVRELRNRAMDTWMEVRENHRSEAWASRDIPSTSARPKTPPHYTFSSPESSLGRALTSPTPVGSSRSLSPGGLYTGEITSTERPIGPVRLGVVFRAPPRSPGHIEVEGSLSSPYVPRVYSPRGYTWMDPDSEDLEGEDSVQGGGVEEADGGVSVTGTQGSETVPEGVQSESTLEMWVPDSPIVEVVNISSDEESELEMVMVKLEPELVTEGSEEQSGSDLMLTTSTSSTLGESSDDPDYVPGRRYALFLL